MFGLVSVEWKASHALLFSALLFYFEHLPDSFCFVFFVCLPIYYCKCHPDKNFVTLPSSSETSSLNRDPLSLWWSLIAKVCTIYSLHTEMCSLSFSRVLNDVVSISMEELSVSCLEGALVNDSGTDECVIFLPFKYLCFSTVALLLSIHVRKDPGVEWMFQCDCSCSCN